MDRTFSRTLRRCAIGLSIVAIAVTLTGCSKLSEMFGSDSASTSVSRGMSEGSKAVNAAATGVTDSLGLTNASGGAAAAKKPTIAQPAAATATASARPRPHGTTPAATLLASTSAGVRPNREPMVAAASEANNVIETATSAATAVIPDFQNEIYSKDDADVLPARLLTSQDGGAIFRGIRPEMNTMELTISSQGRVEQVRLITPARRMTDMLLLSGAKTWKFTPALKEGQPVRYRTMFSWESTP